MMELLSIFYWSTTDIRANGNLQHTFISISNSSISQDNLKYIN